MSIPKEMKIMISYDDGSQKEAKYKLSPLRNGDNPHQVGYVGEPGNSYTEVIEGRGMGFTNHIESARLWPFWAIKERNLWLSINIRTRQFLLHGKYN